MIEVRVRKSYLGRAGEPRFALDMDFQADGLTVLFGASGAGKTQTLDCIAGLCQPDAGRIAAAGAVLFDREQRINLPPQQRACGYVQQEDSLFPHMTLRENLAFARAAPARLETLLNRFQLRDIADRRPSQASGGQRQRCAIARALLRDPRVLLLDEPARGLDGPLREDLYEVLREVRQETTAPLLLVTHDLEECLRLGERMLIISGGRVIQQGTPVDVCDRPVNETVARLLGIFSLLPVTLEALGCVRWRGQLLGGLDTGDRPSGPYWLAVRADEWGADFSPGGWHVTLTRTLPSAGVLMGEFAEGIRAVLADGVPAPEALRPAGRLRLLSR